MGVRPNHSTPRRSARLTECRCWQHSSACWSPRPRTAMVCRFAPWWLSTGEFGQVPTGGPPLTLEEFESCSPALQPLLRHLCNDVPSNMLQQPVLDRAQASVERAAWGAEQARQDPDGVVRANAHVRVGETPRL